MRLLASLLQVTLRTIELWARANRRELKRQPVGRPRIARAERRAARRAVAAELRRQGNGAGWRRLREKLCPAVRMRLLHEHLRALKRALARRRRSAACARRVSVHVHARDVLWAQDATQVGRVRRAPVLAEVVRDAATTSTPGLRVGAPACARDVIALLEDTARERGGLPLVHSADNGGPYRSAELARWSEERCVILLRNVPHVPQHNAVAERANGELKEESGLGTDLPLRDAGEAAARLNAARARLDCARCRTSRGGRTARELDNLLPRGDDLVRREVFYAAARANISRAVQGAVTPRARRLAEREATYATLESFGLINRTRGGRPLHAVESERVL